MNHHRACDSSLLWSWHHSRYYVFPLNTNYNYVENQTCHNINECFISYLHLHIYQFQSVFSLRGEKNTFGKRLKPPPPSTRVNRVISCLRASAHLGDAATTRRDQFTPSCARPRCVRASHRPTNVLSRQVWDCDQASDQRRADVRDVGPALIRRWVGVSGFPGCGTPSAVFFRRDKCRMRLIHYPFGIGCLETMASFCRGAEISMTSLQFHRSSQILLTPYFILFFISTINTSFWTC